MRILDLFCCAGGAAVGYHRAGFEVVGVDIAPQPRYPFAFIQTEIVARITAAPIGSALRFALMDTASAMSRAIEAEAKAQTKPKGDDQ